MREVPRLRYTNNLSHWARILLLLRPFEVIEEQTVPALGQKVLSLLTSSTRESKPESHLGMLSKPLLGILAILSAYLKLSCTDHILGGTYPKPWIPTCYQSQDALAEGNHWAVAKDSIRELSAKTRSKWWCMKRILTWELAKSLDSPVVATALEI